MSVETITSDMALMKSGSETVGVVTLAGVNLEAV